jgi:hypothetical protein
VGTTPGLSTELDPPLWAAGCMPASPLAPEEGPTLGRDGALAALEQLIMPAHHRADAQGRCSRMPTVIR